MTRRALGVALEWVLGLAVAWVAPTLAHAAPPEPLGEARPPTLEDFDAEVRDELAKSGASPEALAAWDRGNEARTTEDLAAAKEAYEKVLAEVPDHAHSLRRLCSIHSMEGEHDRAIARCELALKLSPDVYNHAALAGALVASPELDLERQERVRSVGMAVVDSPEQVDVETLGGACLALARIGHQPGVTTCRSRMQAADPNHPVTLLLDFEYSMRIEDYPQARADLARLEAMGADPGLVADLRRMIPTAHVWMERAQWWGPRVAAAWAVVGVLLLIAGMVLSLVTSRLAHRLASSAEGIDSTGSRVLRRVYRVVLAATCVYYYVSLPLLALTLLALGAGVVFLVLAVGRVPLKLVLILGLVIVLSIIAIVRAIFVKLDDADPGEALDLGQHPGLVKLLKDVAESVGTRPVDRVFVVPGVEMAVFERGSLLDQIRGSTQRCLVIGVSTLEGMDADALSAILAHEYGHFSNRDTAGGGFALRVRASLHTMAASLAESGAATPYNPTWWFIRGFELVFLRVSQGASRLQEVLADRWAVRCHGADAFERGLMHVIERDIRHRVDARAFLGRVNQTGEAMRNLYTAMRGVGTSGHEGEVAAAVNDALEEKPSPFDSHPRPADRIKWAHAYDAALGRPKITSNALAWDVIGGRDALELQMTERVRENLARLTGHFIPREAPNVTDEPAVKSDESPDPDSPDPQVTSPTEKGG